MSPPPTPHTRRWATLNDGAKYVGCTRRTLDRRIAEGKLRRYRNGGKVMVDLNDIDAMLESAS